MGKKSPAKILKEKGLIPKDWDLRKPLSTGQKSWITKQSKTYSQLIARPQDFSVKRVSNANAKILRESGVKTQGNRAIVPKGYRRMIKDPTTGKARIIKDQAKVSIRNGKMTIKKAHQTETVYLKGGPDFLNQLEKLYKKKLKPNQAWALKIGNSPTMRTVRPDLKELIAYARDIDFHSQDALNHVSLVLITSNSPGLVERPDDLEDDEDGEE